MKLPKRPGLQPSPSPRKHRSPALRLFLPGFSMALISGILTLCARTLPGFAQQYSHTVYPVLVNTLGRFSGLFPFSLSEAGLYFTLIFYGTGILLLFRTPLISLARMFFFTCLLLFLFTINCGINYYREPFSYETGMDMKPSSTRELYSLCSFLVAQINSSLEEEDHSHDGLNGLYPGQTKDTPPPTRAALRKMSLGAVAAMEKLGEAYPQLGGFYPYPKPLLNPRLLSVQQLCGIYSPFAIEANYNSEMPYYNIPHTICHELSHLKGYMREDEANFIGYLACIGSQSPDFSYSGYLTGWVYAGNALEKEDRNAYLELSRQLSPRAVQDLKWNNQFWGRFDGEVAEASTRLNDSYLKANRQEDGVQSYGRMVDLMLAYYRASMEPVTPDLHVFP